jgi:signal peptidase
MDLVGLVLFPAFSANFLYHYISKRYGMMPNIMFRVITTLYVYFIPASTGMEEALDSCIKIILPIAIYVFVSAMYEKKQKKAIQKGNKFSAVLTVITVAIMAAIAMLISCQFRFGALVIATESMTGELNKGDILIFDQDDTQEIQEGQVIVFRKYNSYIIHRVVEIKEVNGVTRYYTKGDANDGNDPGYITDKDIVGSAKLKFAYLGYPTLWLRELFT